MSLLGRLGRRGIHSIDAKWLERWRDVPYGPPVTSESKPYYQLPMFPYPSGRLHIGHLRVYTISDTLARFRRMQGLAVRHPIGWDAFGLPAENAAVEHGVNAADWTHSNINEMRAQLRRMLLSFDKDEVVTCSPEYYAHTQRLFLEFFRHGLAYRKMSTVNWDPVDKTVLANEQIDADGKSWRSGAVAEKRDLEQWFLRISKYAHTLDEDLSLLTQWPDKVRTMQHNWIGISQGARVKFGEDLWAFTTRLDTLPGVKFVAIAMDHPLAKRHAVSTRSNGLVEGIEAMNPLTGEPIPVYAAEYVVSDYADGVVMGVPAHDERDRRFWEDVCPRTINLEADLKPFMSDVRAEQEQAQQEIMASLEPKGLAYFEEQIRLRDWLVSRQRFWGAPIPMVHCGSCGVVPVPDKDLPVRLPSNAVNIPLSQNAEWLHTECPKCGGDAHRDPDTMDTFMDSSWYYFRNLDPHNSGQPFAYDAVAGQMPVDFYLGGVEHAILHLLYSRFLAKFLADAGRWDGGDMKGEPFKRLVTLGMVNGRAYRDATTGKYLRPEEASRMPAENIVESVEKMSKSKFNGADPLEVIEAHGADAVRAHMLFQAPVTELLLWDTDKIVGITRWFKRIAQVEKQVFESTAKNASGKSDELWNQAAGLINQITRTLDEAVALNTVVSDEMKLLKLVSDLAKCDQKLAVAAYEALLKVLAPMCPAQAEEFWERLCAHKGLKWSSVHHERWPVLERRGEDGMAEFRIILNGAPQRQRLRQDITEDELLAIAGVDRSQAARIIFKPKQKLLSVVYK